jgi:hypothetical protein
MEYGQDWTPTLESRVADLAPGARGDLIAIPASGNYRQVFEETISFARPVPWMLLDGKMVM